MCPGGAKIKPPFEMGVSDLEEYVMQLQQVAFEEQQEAYCQGIVDTLQIMSGLQLIPMNENIQKLIKMLQ